MELQISNFQRIATAVLRETAAEIGDRVDELVGDVQQQLVERRKRWRVSQERR